MKSKIFLISALLLLGACKQIKSKPITELSQNDAINGILIDVRTPEEFTEGHLENALNIDWRAATFMDSFDTIPKQTPLYLYCRSGKRSLEAANALASAGFQNVVNLEGGYLAWMQK